MIYTAEYRPAREIYVYALAQRFMDESNPDPNFREREVAKQPEGKFWVVFDEESLKIGDPLITRWTIDQIRDEAYKGNALWVADSLGELAQKCGLPSHVLAKTVEGYN
jgi:hypothetical protein